MMNEYWLEKMIFSSGNPVDEWISTKEFFSTISPIDGDEWSVVYRRMNSNPVERRIVETLSYDLTVSGRFREPIVVINNRVENGMHRAVAYMFNAERQGKILITRHQPCLDQETYVLVKARLKSIKIYPTIDLNEVVSQSLIAIRSFPISESVWAETDLLSYSDGVLTAIWTCPFDMINRFVRELEIVANGCGLTLGEGLRTKFLTYQELHRLFDDVEDSGL